jgi:hypothetical protein
MPRAHCNRTHPGYDTADTQRELETTRHKINGVLYPFSAAASAST